MATDKVTRRLAAIFAADMVGYSRLIEADEEGTIARHKAHRKELIDPKISEHDGRIVKLMGDGMLVEFASVVEAVRCAVEVQQAMAKREADVADDRRIAYRVGINLGDIVIDGDDILGDGVNVAARLEGLAEPGGICVSDMVQQSVEGKLELTFEDLGTQQVKNIKKPIQVYRVKLNGATTPAGDAPMYEKQTLALPDKPSIAVLPFANMSGDPEQEYFSDGIAEDIITALSRMPWFFVKARNSTFTYKGRAIQVKAVSKELGARYVIEGSVRKSGDRVRITVQLIDAENDKHLWAERYDRELKEVFAVQDEITERIVASIAPGFLSAEMQRAHRKPAPNLGAWDHFMRALWHFARFNREDSVEAKRRVQKAIELDPRGAVYSGLLAIILVIEWLYGWHEHDSEALTEARRAAERAITLDDHNAQARRALGLVNLYSRRHDQAIRDFKQALELCPTEAENHALLGTTLGLAGDYLIGLRHVEEALRLSPRDTFRATWFNNLAMAASAAGDDKASVDWARKAIETNPTLPGGYRSLAASAGNLGRRSQARAALETLCELLPGLTVAHAKARLPFKNSADLERYLDGLRKAGLPE